MNAIEFDPADHFTLGAVGEPGKRTFILQATSGEEHVGLVIEKEHVLALARWGHVLLAQVGYPEPPPAWDEKTMAIDESIEPSWRVGSMGFGFEETRDLVLVECEELVEEGEEPSKARFWVNRSQLAAAGQYGLVVASRGRPICPLCGRPMDAEGHRCFALNGHGATDA